MAGDDASLAYVRFGSLADIRGMISDVRFTPKSGHAQRQNRCPLSAISRPHDRPDSAGITRSDLPEDAALRRRPLPAYH